MKDLGNCEELINQLMKRDFLIILDSYDEMRSK
jgi:hypothetical protein